MGTVNIKPASEVEHEHRLSLVRQIETQRKEAEREGVTVNGIRYSGSQSNRQALDEAVRHAEKSGLTAFDGWKDSDGQFHVDHPVADVADALDAIATRRSALIGKEGEYAKQVMGGTLTDVSDLDWTV